MPVRVVCPNCGTAAEVSRQHVGRKGRCANSDCGKVFILEPVQKAKTPRKVSEPEFPYEDMDWFDDDNGEPPQKSSQTTHKKSRRPNTSTQSSPSRRRGARKRQPKKKESYQHWVILSGLALLVPLGLLVSMFTNGSSSPTESSLQAAEPPSPDVIYQEKIVPFFKNYCFDCHSKDIMEGELSIEQYTSVKQILEDRKPWERIYDMVRVGAMPPSDVDMPSEAERLEVANWLDKTLFHMDCNQATDPGRVTIRRLNRNEYNNTIRDLMHVDFKPAADFPLDDVGYGFDNIGDVLTVSPLLMERYLDAAEDITERALFSKESSGLEITLKGDKLKHSGSVSQGRDGIKSFPSTGEIYANVNFPAAGTYRITVLAAATQAGNELARMELRLNNKNAKSFDVTGHIQRKDYSTEVRVDQGNAKVSVAFVNDFYDPDNKDRNRRDRNLFVGNIRIEGPTQLNANDYPLAHQELLKFRPEGNQSVKQAAEKNLRPFMTRAFRRPVSSSEVEKFVGIVELAAGRGESFERAMQFGVQAVLVSPQFLFRHEHDFDPNSAKSPHSITDYELASRLSYFIWSSMPDDELFELAGKNKLHEDATLEQQVRRMLNDPKANALIENFSGQWLGLRKLEEHSLDKEIFPAYSEKLKQAMWKETELFFGSIVKEDRNVLDLLDADYTYINEPLARLYGIPGVRGEKFQKVSLKGTKRAGVLTHASILTLTSYPTRTSPVKRGEWVLDNILGESPPPAPPVVPSFEETQESHPDLSLREQLKKHREDPTCASCHKLMDPIGFGFENFDALGAWREADGNFDIVASGELPSGDQFDGPITLVKILKSRELEFSRCLAEKMMTYALGRGVEWYDRCAIDHIVGEMSKDNFRFSRLIIEVAQSDPFRKRRGDGEKP